MGMWTMGDQPPWWEQSPLSQIWRGPGPDTGWGLGGAAAQVSLWILNQMQDLHMPSWCCHFLITKSKIWHGEYMDLFTLLFWDMEVKEEAKDEPRKLEKIKCRQVDKNYANWLSTCTIYMRVVI